ncbi:nucleotide exchange factor GrpE [Aggregatilinea lenta]|uniref:nucleotide exchange factor GrpE n=1 Tax=Aggregatilinea lenta TaxID=913108 RepID=UPI00350E35F5
MSRVPGETQHPNDNLRTDSVSDSVSEDEVNAPVTDATGASGQAETSDALASEEEVSLQTQISQANARAEEFLDSLQRERASFQNYKKRVEKERAEQRQQVAGDVLVKLLPVLDDFYRAIDAVPEGERDGWFNGITLILRKMERFLDEQGVKPIEALGKPFDPAFHEAIGVDPDSDAESGTVTAVLQRGYASGERVLRPAMVRVAG